MRFTNQSPWVSRTSQALALAAAVAGLTGCELTEAETEAIEDALYLDPSGGVAPPVNVQPACFLERFVQPEAEITRKIDLLFVTDTSGSLDDERAAIADGIDAFVAALPTEADFRVGVMLGHSSKSSHAGRLFRSSSTEPRVLDSQTLSMAEIRAHLRNKMTRTVGDWYADGGEENFYSLLRGLASDRMTESRGYGFFREDAALAVIFVSDEQEICADFPAGVTPVPDSDNLEGPAKFRDCSRVVDGVPRKIDHHYVYESLSNLQGDRPLVVSGIYYSRIETVPRVNENEFGYGYAELMALAHGVSVDLAEGHYQQGLSDIGTLARIKLNLITDYTLARVDIDPATIRVEIDAVAAPFDYNAGINAVHLPEPGGALSVVDLHYCMRADEPGEDEEPGGGGEEEPGEEEEPGGGGEPECTGLDCGVIGV
ncbi:MAG: hypothetical protein IT285_07290 [Bdellovibrionales bacterium]|nr:hypothetical protein [Bdellovibrionales bacterium]